MVEKILHLKNEWILVQITQKNFLNSTGKGSKFFITLLQPVLYMIHWHIKRLSKVKHGKGLNLTVELYIKKRLIIICE